LILLRADIDFIADNPLIVRNIGNRCRT
jgi:hypothetical protein